MKAALSCAILAAIGATVLLAASAVGANSRPNILLITADDLGCELGCYGDQTATTPNLDALARDGVRFDRAFVTSASCSPSRSSIFTGRYPHENGQIGLSHCGFSMHPGQVSFPALLNKAGYHTGVIGKVHGAPASAVPFDFDTNGELPGSKTNARTQENTAGYFNCVNRLDVGVGRLLDIQSLGHLLLYADVLDLRGLIESEPRRKQGQRISYAVDAYESVFSLQMDRARRMRDGNW